MHLVHRQTCRICGSSALTRVIDLGDQHLQGSFAKPGKRTPPLRKLPTSLVRCDPVRDESACGLLQTEFTVPPEVLYSSYWYRSATNSTMRHHLQGIVTQAIEMSAKKPSLVLDIGCNDGTLLSYYPEGVERFGIDPSDVVVEVTQSATTIVHDLFPSAELESVLNGRKFDVITAIAMFYDLESPVSFVRSIKDCLAENGVWIFEMSYLPTMLEKGMYDTICHEHLEYYSLAVVERVLRIADMKLVRAELNDSNGGSIRCFATHSASFAHKDFEHLNNLKIIREREFDLALDTDRPYRLFQERINLHREELNKMIWALKQDGKTIHVYGASTKGNTILQWCGLDNRVIDMAAERNPEKFGARTLGTNIPIVSETESRALHPDYYLVLPWHFRKEILEREKETLLGGTKLIFPLPHIEVVG